jgi:hypothetical protein
MGLKKIGWKAVDRMHVAQDRGHWRTIVNMVINLGVPLKAVNFLISEVTISFSRTLSCLFVCLFVCLSVSH